MILTRYVKARISKVVKRLTNRLSSSYKINSIHDSYVAHAALSGCKTEIMTDTFIDKLSKVGSYCYIGRNVNITKTEIGNYCSIANNVSIGQGEHIVSNISTHSMFYDNAHEVLTAKHCVIEHDVWVGVDAIILRGVRIGIGAIVGANSVVTENVPPFAIVVGSPAKVIKYRFDVETQHQILDSHWWGKNPAEAKKIFDGLEK